jgi:hypothetical protein
MSPAASPDLTALLAPMDAQTITALLDHMDPARIVQRLQELEAQSRSLRVLLRAVRARQRARNSTAPATAKGVPCGAA